jgi:exopolyphosphatase/guanosine-5'-triphosphate,3'-diphosphate pyrophosphatase
MKVAAIDLGTNIFHFAIAEITNHSFEIIYQARQQVWIGRETNSEGYISEEGQLKAIRTIKDYQLKIQEYNVEKVLAYATSALRTAKNSSILIEKIHAETNIKVQIINGEQEAELIYYGVCSEIALPFSPVLIADIGGGSVEFIIANKKGIIWKQSFEIGGQRLWKKFCHDDPITPESSKAIYAYLFETLKPLKKALQQHNPVAFIGTAGAYETIRDIYSPTNTAKIVTIDNFEAVYERILPLKRLQRAAVKGMVSERIDMIIPALHIIKAVFELSSLKEYTFTEASLREGILYHYFLVTV